MVFVLSSYRGGYKIIAFIGFCWYKIIDFNCSLYLYLLSCVADEEELDGQEPEASEETDRARAGQGRGSEVSVCQFV